MSSQMGQGEALVDRDDKARWFVSIRSARMSLSNFAVLLFAVALAASGQVILKHGMTRSAANAKEHGTSLAENAIGNGWVWLGLAFFGISALAWMPTHSTPSATWQSSPPVSWCCTRKLTPGPCSDRSWLSAGSSSS